MNFPSIYHRHLVEHFGEKESAVLRLSIIGARKMYEARQKSAVTVMYRDTAKCDRETLQVIKSSLHDCKAKRPPKYRVRYETPMPGDKYGQTWTKKSGEIERGSVSANLP